MRMIWKCLAVTALCAAPALAQGGDTLAGAAPVRQANPDGAGHPNAVTCRAPQQLPGSRLMAPPVCLINADWARLRRDGEDISPDGKRIVASEKERSLNPPVCSNSSNTAFGNPKGASMATGWSSSPVCF